MSRSDASSQTRLGCSCQSNGGKLCVITTLVFILQPPCRLMMDDSCACVNCFGAVVSVSLCLSVSLPLCLSVSLLQRAYRSSSPATTSANTSEGGSGSVRSPALPLPRCDNFRGRYDGEVKPVCLCACVCVCVCVCVCACVRACVCV